VNLVGRGCTEGQEERSINGVELRRYYTTAALDFSRLGFVFFFFLTIRDVVVSVVDDVFVSLQIRLMPSGEKSTTSWTSIQTWLLKKVQQNPIYPFFCYSYATADRNQSWWRSCDSEVLRAEDTRKLSEIGIPSQCIRFESTQRASSTISFIYSIKCSATSVVYFKRFFLYNSIISFDPKIIMWVATPLLLVMLMLFIDRLSCIYTACKTEDQRIAVDSLATSAKVNHNYWWLTTRQ